MIAIFKHELKNYFQSFTAYVFGAFLLLFIGIGSMFYNVQAAVSNFEYVLNFGSLIFVVIVPILTMRVIAEERKQKTDQLLYSLPISTTQVIFGKFFALIIVYLIPLCIISIYPLLFAQFGDVCLLTAYGSIFAFYMLGAALISVGIFISSLTENQGFAAGIGIALILFNYYSVNLAEYVSSTAIGSIVVLSIVAIVIGVVICRMTQNTGLGYGISFFMMIALLILYRVDNTKLEGLIPNVMKKLSLFDRFTTVVNGVFDLTTIIFYLTIIGFFLFLSIQSMEKRRYN